MISALSEGALGETIDATFEEEVKNFIYFFADTYIFPITRNKKCFLPLWTGPKAQILPGKTIAL